MLAACCLAAAAGTADAGRAKAVGTERALAVSVPADPVPAQLGKTVRTLIRIVNPNTAAVRVTVQSRSLMLGDDGKVSIAPYADPRWAHAVGFPVQALSIPAEGYRDVHLVVHMPEHLPPDMYFVGFVVTPVSTAGGSIKVINQIGSFLTLDVPGPRLRRLVGHLHLPGFVLGSHVDGTLRLTNTGKASLSFWARTTRRRLRAVTSSEAPARFVAASRRALPHRRRHGPAAVAGRDRNRDHARDVPGADGGGDSSAHVHASSRRRGRVGARRARWARARSRRGLARAPKAQTPCAVAQGSPLGSVTRPPSG